MYERNEAGLKRSWFPFVKNEEAVAPFWKAGDCKIPGKIELLGYCWVGAWPTLNPAIRLCWFLASLLGMNCGWNGRGGEGGG